MSSPQALPSAGSHASPRALRGAKQRLETSLQRSPERQAKEETAQDSPARAVPGNAQVPAFMHPCKGPHSLAASLWGSGIYMPAQNETAAAARSSETKDEAAARQQHQAAAQL